ncbi:MAG: hypothetical protein Fur0022_28840 [Anaerolineales bacterium]
MLRWFTFFFSILLGLAGGLYYGWVINPVEYVNTTPDTLRIDYKTDFVLMVAEVYQAENKVENALRRLALLGDETPITLVDQALTYAQANSYGQTDLNLLTELREAIQTWHPADIPAGEGVP